MDFSESPATIDFRHQVRQVLATHLTDDVRRGVASTGTHHDWALHRAMADRGWVAASLPAELGGQGRGPDQLAALFRELELAEAPYDGMANTMMVAFILGHVGSDWQRAEVFPRLLSGEAIPCLGYSEPESGSDVAAAVTRAERDGDSWRITGSKMFTSLAEEARWVFLLTRTNTDVAKHKGLTFFLVPMDSPGITVTPIHTMGGKRTNITFYDDVVVDDRWRVGPVDGGWGTMLVALAFERGVAGGVADIAALYAHARSYATEQRGHGGGRLIDQPHVRSRLARVAIDATLSELLGVRAAAAAASGVPRQEGAEAKLFGTEAYGRAANTLLDALGPEAVLTNDGAGEPRVGDLERAFRYAPVLTVAGGTSEIQRNLIAERTLGLPRNR